MALNTSLTVTTNGRNTYEVTQAVEHFITDSNIDDGVCHVFCQHTSASLIITENADPDVQQDLETFMTGLVRDGDPRFIHTLEGEDDMPSHIRSALTNSSLTIPIVNKKLALGTWQGVFLWEHRYASQQRKLIITLVS